MHRNTYHLIVWGGYGDMVMSTVLLKEIKGLDPLARITIYIPHELRRQIFENNPYIDRISIGMATHFFSFFLMTKLRTVYHLQYGKYHPSYFPDRTPIDIMAEIVGLKLKERKVCIYLTEQEDLDAKALLEPYKNPICFQAGTRGVNKIWYNDKWADLIKEMPDYTFIQLGRENEAPIEGAVVLLGKTSFRESMALIKHSLSFVGVDSAFAHVTNAFNTPGVILFGATTPKVWGQTNNINIYKAIRCSPCVDVLGNSPCPYNRRCMDLISVADVKAALTAQLGRTKA
jgi:ADP-heptose:LPS heptosyltransferase